MAIVLDVYSLPRAERSRTRKLRDAFFNAYLAKHPDTSRIELDLARDYDKLPAFDEWDVQTKFEMAYGDGILDGEMAARWDALIRQTDKLHGANLVVVTCPMWNFSIPWHMKRWIDCVVQPRLTFEFSGGAFRGLLAGRAGVILTTRDGAYGPGTPGAALDFEVPYLKTVLGFMGLDPIHTVIAEPMALAGPEVMKVALAKGIEQAAELGGSL
jgi:FMN-dependent NADH-azoreductase